VAVVILTIDDIAAVAAAATAAAVAVAARKGEIECPIGLGVEVGRRRGGDPEALIYGGKTSVSICTYSHRGGEGGRDGGREGGQAADDPCCC